MDSTVMRYDQQHRVGARTKKKLLCRGGFTHLRKRDNIKQTSITGMDNFFWLNYCRKSYILPKPLRCMCTSSCVKAGHLFVMHKTQTIPDAHLNQCLFLNSTLFFSIQVYSCLRHLLPVSLMYDSGGAPLRYPLEIILELP
jgi:hypothetical protein